MPNYTFILKKKDLKLELQSSNPDLIASEMEKWMKDILGISSEPIVTPTKIKSSKKTAKSVEEAKPVKKIAELVEEAEDEIPVKEPPKEKNLIRKLIKSPELKFKKVEIEAKKETLIEEEPEEESIINEFQEILNQKIKEEPEKEEINIVKSFKTEAPVIKNKEFTSLEGIIEDKNPQILLDYLIISAYYLKNIEKFDKFALKQINGKILPFSKKPIDHSIIQNAVTKNLIEVVPDKTGMAEVTEYTITSEGEQYLINEL